MKEDDDELFDSFEDDDEFFQGDDPSPLRPSAPERIRGVERDFYARLSCARFKYIPAMPGLKSWLFFVGYALAWTILLVVYIYSSVIYTHAWLIIFGIVFLAGMALGGVFLIRGVVFYYYDAYVCRVKDKVVIVMFSKWNRDVTVYFSRDEILRLHRGAVEERGDYAYQYVGTHLLFNKFKTDIKYGAGSAYETISALSANGGTVRMRIENDLPASITYASAPSLRSEFGAVKCLKLVEYAYDGELPALPAALARECRSRGLELPDRFPVGGNARGRRTRAKKRAEKRARDDDED